MTQDNMIIRLTDKELAIEHLYSVEDYFTFNIWVKSGSFSGASHFCLPKEVIKLSIEKLTKMNNELTGCCEIADNDSDAYITFSMDKFGHMIVSGQIGGSQEEHFMKFRYNTDQTIIDKLVKLLTVLL